MTWWAAEVADGLVGLVGNEDRDEFSGAQQAGEFDGVLFVGFDMIARLGRDQRGGDDGAVHLHPRKEPRNPHAASSGFIAYGDAGKGDAVGLGDAFDQPLKGNLRGGNLTIGTDFALRSGIGNGNGNFFFMDVESDVK